MVYSYLAFDEDITVLKSGAPAVSVCVISFFFFFYINSYTSCLISCSHMDLPQLQTIDKYLAQRIRVFLIHYFIYWGECINTERYLMNKGSFRKHSSLSVVCGKPGDMIIFAVRDYVSYTAPQSKDDHR